MKLLYTITAYPPSTGGAQTHAHLLAFHLSPTHQIEVASFWDTNRTDWLLGTTIDAPRSPLNYTLDSIYVHRICLSITNRFRMVPAVALYYPLMPASTHYLAGVLTSNLFSLTAQTELVHSFRIGREPLSYASLSLARKRDVPFAFTPFHHPRWVGWRYQAYIDLYKQADVLFALTEAERDEVVRLGVRPERVEVIGHGPQLALTASPERFILKFGIRAPFVLFLGQFYPYKGFKEMLKAAKHVWQKHPDAEFVFVGPAVGNSEQTFAQIADRRIHRLGTVDLQTKTDALAACALLCVPSMQESFGGVYTEAWSFAKPVIGGRIPAVAHLITDGSDGFLVSQDSNEIADRINVLLSSNQLAQQMGRRGEQKVKDKYGWEQIGKRVATAYSRLV